MAATKDLVIDKGATFKTTFTWNTKENNILTPVDLTGYTARCKMKESYDSTTAVVDLTTENDGITLGDALGTIELLIEATATTAITIDKGVWDLELVNGTEVIRLLEGKVTFKPEVTK